jgi:hypothetical protein
MTTNELTGRELADACCTAMGGWECGHGLEDPEPGIDDMLAWLHERGEVEVNSNSRGASAALWLPDVNRGPDDCKVGGTTPAARGSNITEALQRLVVAVAQRGSGGRA